MARPLRRREGADDEQRALKARLERLLAVIDDTLDLDAPRRPVPPRNEIRARRPL